MGRLSIFGTFLLLIVLPCAAVMGQSRSARKTAPVPRDMHHPERHQGRADELERLTNRPSKTLPPSPAIPIGERNYIDKYIFGKISHDKIPHALLCSDTEFVRRVSLDLTGRLPEPDRIREFIKNSDPQKRDKLVDALMATSTKGVTKKPSTPFLDRWAYLFSDLFRVNALMNRGRT